MHGNVAPAGGWDRRVWSLRGVTTLSRMPLVGRSNASDHLADDPSHPARPMLGFVGRPADKRIRSKYLGRSVKDYFTKGNRSPIHYVNC